MYRPDLDNIEDTYDRGFPDPLPMVQEERTRMQITRGDTYVAIRLDPREAEELAEFLRQFYAGDTEAVSDVLSTHLDAVLEISHDSRKGT